MTERDVQRIKARIVRLAQARYWVEFHDGYKNLHTGVAAVTWIMSGNDIKVYRNDKGDAGQVIYDTSKVAVMPVASRAMAFLSTALRLRNAESMKDVLRQMGFIV